MTGTPLATDKKTRRSSGGKKGREADGQGNEVMDEDTEKSWKRNIQFCSSTILLSASAHLPSDCPSWMESSLPSDHRRKRPITLSTNTHCL